jgi:4'-phosphopantetheinyl transferase EntD
MAAMPSVAYQDLFSIPVAAAEMRELGDPALLHPAEAGYLGRAVAKRRGEFAAGRLCARRALEELGILEFPVRVAADRQPIWPVTMVGSITHTDGLCAAVVADRSRALGIGIDSEVVAPMSHAMRVRICVPAESDWLASLPKSQRAAGAMLIFSAKEAFYKCQFPLVGEWLDFKDVCVEAKAWPAFEPGERGPPARFLIRAMRPLALGLKVASPLSGHYRFHEEFVSAGIALEAPAPSIQ